MSKQQDRKDQTKRFNQNIYRGFAIAAVLLLILVELMIGNIPYYIKWQQCGRQPVIVTQPESIGFGAQPQKYFAYTHPGFFDSKLPLISIFGKPVAYCSLEEVQQNYGSDVQIRN